MSAVDAQERYIRSGKNTRVVYNEDGTYSLHEDDGTCTDENVVISVEDLGYCDDYVYDLETEDGTFCAGVGSIIVHNTDSVFVTYKDVSTRPKIDIKNEEQMRQVLAECFSVGGRMASEVTTMFRSPINLEFEKVYLPHIMLGKKMYVGAVYESTDPRKRKVDKKGIVLKRRDNANITKIIYQQIIDILFTEGEPGIKRCLEYLSTELDNIISRNVPLEDLIITKTYKKDYKSDNISHKILAERMAKRDPGSAPRYNDRVPFVFIESKDKKKKQYEKVEHPDYVRANNLVTDVLYYIKQVHNPVVSLLSSFVPENEVERIFREKVKKYEMRNQKLITSFFPIAKK